MNIKVNNNLRFLFLVTLVLLIFNSVDVAATTDEEKGFLAATKNYVIGRTCNTTKESSGTITIGNGKSSSCIKGSFKTIDVSGVECDGTRKYCLVHGTEEYCDKGVYSPGKCKRRCIYHKEEKTQYCYVSSGRTICEYHTSIKCASWEKYDCYQPSCTEGGTVKKRTVCTRYDKPEPYKGRLPQGSKMTIQCGQGTCSKNFANEVNNYFYDCKVKCTSVTGSPELKRWYCPGSTSCHDIYCIEPDKGDPNGTYQRIDSDTIFYNNQYKGLAYILKYSSSLGSYTNIQNAVFYYLNALGAISSDAVPSGNAKTVADRAIAYTKSDSLKTASSDSSAITVYVNNKNVQSNNIEPELKIVDENGVKYIDSDIIRILGMSGLSVPTPSISVPEGFNASIVVTEQTTSSYAFKIRVKYDPSLDLLKLQDISANVNAKIELSKSDLLVPVIVVLGPSNGNGQRVIDIVEKDASKSFKISFSKGVCDYDTKFDETVKNGCCSNEWYEIFLKANKVTNREEFIADHPECANCKESDKGSRQTSADCSKNANYGNIKDNIGINSECMYSDDYDDKSATSYYHDHIIGDYCKVRCVENFDMNFPGAPLNRINNKKGESIPGYAVKAGYFVWPNTKLTFNYFGDKTFYTTGTKSCRIMVDRLGLRMLSQEDASKEIGNCITGLNNINAEEFYSTKAVCKLSYKYDASFEDSINHSRNNIELINYGNTTNCKIGTINSISSTPNCLKIGDKISLSGDLENKIKQLRNYRFDIIKVNYYKIPDNINAYVDYNGIAHDEDKDNYSVIGFGNIPLNFRTNGLEFYQYSDKNGTYDRTIAGTVGIDCNVTGHFNGRKTSYVCRFEATKYIGETYSCGVDTVTPNYPITDCVKSQKNVSLEAAIENCESTICSGYFCPEGTKMAGKDVKDDVNEELGKLRNEGKCDGLKNSECLAKAFISVVEKGKCDGNVNPPSGKFYCPSCEENPNQSNCFGSGPNDMSDITECVKAEMMKGFNLERAKNNCEIVNCPYKAGRVVIYRPIVYENPFPSISSSGRIPGANWRSTSDVAASTVGSIERHYLVKKYILGRDGRVGNRGSDTNDVYNAVPLYRFVITAENINAIRNASETEVYDKLTDEAFTCQLHGRACISNIVHTYLDQNNGGTCAILAPKKTGQYEAYYKCVEGDGK